MLKPFSLSSAYCTGKAIVNIMHKNLTYSMSKNLFITLSILFFCCFSLLAFRTFWTLSHTFTPDFSVYFQAAKNISTSLSVYTGPTRFTLFAYPLVSGVLFLPFIFLPYQTAQTTFLFLNFLALFGISFLSTKLLLKQHLVFFTGVIFSFAYLPFPTKFTLGMGQVNLIACLLLLLSVYIYKQNLFKSTPYSHLLTGISFAVASMLKPILIFFLLFFLVQKQWRITLYVISTFVVFFLFSLLIDHQALQDYMYYLFHVLPEVSKPVGKEIYYNQGLMSFVFREISNQQTRLAISYLGMLGLLFSGLFAIYNTKNILFQVSLLLTMIPLLDTLSWQHHFVFLIFPFLFAVTVCIKQKLWKWLGAIVAAYALVSWNFMHPELFTIFPKNLLLSNTFYGGLLLFLFFIFHQKSFQEHASH